MPFFCYLLECSDGTYYCGWTKDVDRRVETHNKGRGARYTRARRPVKLVYFEELPSQGDAMRREHKLKQKSHDKKAALIRQFAENTHDQS
jgi:putative endonuclease